MDPVTDGARRETGPIEAPFANRHFEVSRIEGFSDAVFAFALTLLVVSLEVPRTFAELTEAMRGFVAFAVCFAMLYQVWWRHYNYFRRYGLDDKFTRAVTGVLLFVVLFYVYPMKFMWTLVARQMLGGSQYVDGPGGHEPIIVDAQVPTLFIIYGLGLWSVFTVFAALYAHAYRLRDSLKLSPVEILETRLSVASHLMVGAVGLLSAGLAWIFGLRAMPWTWAVYFLIGVVEWGIGWYRGGQLRRIDRETSVASRMAR